MAPVTLADLRVFVRVAELASFTRAAEQLGVAKGRVSAVVSDLEARIGARLLHRSTRIVRLTDEGERFLDRARALLADAEQLGAMFRPMTGGLVGRLRIDLPYVIAREVVIPRLPEFTDANPSLDLAVSTTDRRVDLVHEGFDCAMIVGSLPDSGLAVRHLGAMRMMNAASPAYLARHGVPEAGGGLAGHRVVHYAADLSSRDAAWIRKDAEGRYVRTPVAAGLTVNGFDAYQAAAVAGLGMIQAPEAGLRALVAAGVLVPVLPEDEAPPVPVSLLYPAKHQLAPRVRSVMDWLGTVMRDTL